MSPGPSTGLATSWARWTHWLFWAADDDGGDNKLYMETSWVPDTVINTSHVITDLIFITTHVEGPSLLPFFTRGKMRPGQRLGHPPVVPQLLGGRAGIQIQEVGPSVHDHTAQLSCLSPGWMGDGERRLTTPGLTQDPASGMPTTLVYRSASPCPL